MIFSKIDSLCDKVKRCKDCGVLLRSFYGDIKKHSCGYFECHTCNKYVPRDDHRCYIQPIEDKALDATLKKNKAQFIFFDFFNFLEKLFFPNISSADGKDDDGGTFQHKVNCGCAMRMCDTCKATPDAEDCSVCGDGRKIAFLGDDALDKFCSWLFSKERHIGWTAMAHNARGFDSQFLIDYLHLQRLKPRKVVPKGESESSCF